VHLKKTMMTALLCATLLAGYSFANEHAEDNFGFNDPSWINNVPPITYWGTRGLTQTGSGEALGMGRLNFMLLGSYVKQEQALEKLGGSPYADAAISTWRAGFSWGMNDMVDFFGAIPFYFITNPEPKRNFAASLGQLTAGVQFSMPIPEEIPLRIGFQGFFNYGLKTGNLEEYDITTNPNYMLGAQSPDWYSYDPVTNTYIMKYDSDYPMVHYAGYDFLEAAKRDRLDVILKAHQSLVAGNLRRGIKLHLNEGVALMPRVSDKQLLLLGAGLQIDPTEFMTIGFEWNWRTILTEASPEDPMWVTPSVMFRSPYYSEGLFGMSVVFGMDLRVSQPKTVKDNNDQDFEVYPLEKYRIFGDLVFSFDLLASKRAEMIRQARENAAERARLKKLAQLSEAQRDSVTRRAREDSLRLASQMMKQRMDDSIRAKHVADSLAALMGESEAKRVADSIAAAHAAAQMGADAAAREAALRSDAHQRETALRAEAEQKRHADSLAFAKQLEEERAKRSEQEKMLLSTGMIVLADVNFMPGKAELHRNSRPYLAIIAKMLAKYPKLKIEIQGHTDNTGRYETNMALSQARAESVVLFMHNSEPALAKAQMLSAKGYGPTVPKADNNTAAGREENRRVELKVLNPEILEQYR